MMKKAFTLVELIIVITILAILATIAFVSFSNYTASSRDVHKITNLLNIEKTINIFFSQTSSYPSISNISLTGIFNNNEVFYQGNFDNITLSKLGFGNMSKNQFDFGSYLYSFSKNRKDYQIFTGLEVPIGYRDNKLLFNSYANLKQAKVVGNYNGLLVQDGNIYNFPSLIISGSGNINSSDSYFIVNKGNNFSVQANNTINNTLSDVFDLIGSEASTLTGMKLPCNKNLFLSLSGSFEDHLGYPREKIGEKLFGTKFFTSENLIIPGCNEEYLLGNAYNKPRSPCETETISITAGTGTYKIASCNVGAIQSGTGILSYGYFFQWGNQADFPNNGSNLIIITQKENTTMCSPNNCNFNTFIGNGTSPYDWSSSKNNFLWGGDCINSDSPNQECKLKSRGVCPEGFHIPTRNEWGKVITALSIGSNGVALSEGVLKLPLAGIRNYSTSSPTNRGIRGAYWSSTPYNDQAYSLFFYSGHVGAGNYYSRAGGLSVRCFKN